MAEICDIGKSHQIATTEAVMRAKEMFDTLRKNDVCEENEAIQKKYDQEKHWANFSFVLVEQWQELPSNIFYTKF